MNQRLHPDGRNVQIQEQSQTKELQARRKHQVRTTQVGQEAQAEQVPTSPKKVKVWALHTPDGQSHYNP